jgi:hypothetical protein
MFQEAKLFHKTIQEELWASTLPTEAIFEKGGP